MTANRIKILECSPSGIGVSDTNCGAVGPGRQAACPLVKWEEAEEKKEAPDYARGVLPLNWDGTEPNRTVTCMVLKAKANDKHKNLALCMDEFRGP
ncbi:uncharacterized protein TNCV_1242031 [Trichonephila clavipes]|nr:uncharacterized protein TNCV_1242031 [Trichonephila clavipes]